MTRVPTAEAALEFTVTDADTAAAVGSGSLPVLGTPRLPSSGLVSSPELVPAINASRASASGPNRLRISATATGSPRIARTWAR